MEQLSPFYRADPIRPGLTRILDAAGTSLYLAEGETAALLVDTGVGAGDLAAAVRQLTDKPLSVLVTHGHVDHAMGAGAFPDVPVYMSPLDRAVYTAHSALPLRRGYVAAALAQDRDPAGPAPVGEGDFLPPLPVQSFLPLAPGARFDLGGVTAEMLEGAGHTPGCVTVLFSPWRVLLLGDACNSFTFLFEPCCPTVAAYRRTLLALRERGRGRYDRVLYCHGSGEGPDTLDAVLAVCDDVLAGRSDRVPFRHPIGEGVIAKAMDFPRFCRADGGLGNLVYDPQKVGDPAPAEGR